MENRLLHNTAKVISLLFHPFVIPTLGFLIIYYHIPGVEQYPVKLRNILLGIVIFSTCLLPLSFIMLMSATSKLSHDMLHHRDRMLPYIFSAFSIFLGAQLLGKLPLPNVFRIFLLGSCLVLIILFMITLKWKISGHAAAMGSLLGVFLSLIFRYGIDLKWTVIAAIVAAGVVASSRIILNKHTPAQVYAGFVLGVSVLYLTVYLF